MASSVTAVMRALEILELVADAPRGLTGPEIAKATSVPRTSVYELTSTLVDCECLARSHNDPNRFVLGVQVLRLGARYMASLDLTKLGQQAAEKVAARCGETVNVGILEKSDVLYLISVSSTQAVRPASELGKRRPAYSTAMGRVLLAELTETERRELLPAGLALHALTPNTITSVEDLEAEIQRVRRSGVAYEHGETNEEVACVAAAVRDLNGQAIAAMSITVPRSRWTNNYQKQLTAIVKDGASALSMQLGYEMTGRETTS